MSTDLVQPVLPNRTALLLMDFQQGIVARFPGASAVLARASAARDIARRAGCVVGYVRVAFTEQDYRAVSPNNVRFTQAAREHSMDEADPFTAIDQRLTPEPDEIVVRKVRVGAFSTTDLAEQLARRGCDTLVLAGISTSGVVLSTVRDAADRDYRVLVLADCCLDQPDIHRFLIEQIFPRQAEVIDSDALAALLGPTD